ncbi:MAG: helix-turn-helix transcriptional regulator [Clostridiales bacterium]|nr:helix-turn-helix transcriptional regulator [Clostridiales bacterium]
MGKKVGKLIKAARTEADLTQEQLARRVSGVSANDISLAERGEKDLTQAQLKAIAKATGVTQASLINAAKEESGTAKKTSTSTKKTTTTAKKTTTTAKKAKTPSNANTSMKVTSTEKKLIEAYRLADSDTKKRAMSVLKGEAFDLSDVVEDVIENLLGKN